MVTPPRGFNFILGLDTAITLPANETVTKGYVLSSWQSAANFLDKWIEQQEELKAGKSKKPEDFRQIGCYAHYWLDEGPHKASRTLIKEAEGKDFLSEIRATSWEISPTVKRTLETYIIHNHPPQIYHPGPSHSKRSTIPPTAHPATAGNPPSNKRLAESNIPSTQPILKKPKLMLEDELDSSDSGEKAGSPMNLDEVESLDKDIEAMLEDEEWQRQVRIYEKGSDGLFDLLIAEQLEGVRNDSEETGSGTSESNERSSEGKEGLSSSGNEGNDIIDHHEKDDDCQEDDHGDDESKGDNYEEVNSEEEGNQSIGSDGEEGRLSVMKDASMRRRDLVNTNGFSF